MFLKKYRCVSIGGTTNYETMCHMHADFARKNPRVIIDETNQEPKTFCTYCSQNKIRLIVPQKQLSALEQ